MARNSLIRSRENSDDLLVELIDTTVDEVGDRLTEWEQGFLDDIRDAVRNKKTLTEYQHEKLKEICIKHSRY
jgi:23S rRNA C2498 (ribose-2'-O)-methylase RlmM